ncbi:50S ribosomal protein L21 [Candidatus Annandia adelgestsuga]|uniref:Large ribosomal subunit protein bL21 n=1 Tax=Candidatus Annandia adelgestsuga TaxID=1302411 RepID=A0A3S9J7N9_9ENTR|nr:50S ribosomal protein L21 [Candidatus Annandia adelgestsuga]AZP36300.1 50S ribosomal protein L21 [Candidatus Annandia adelgestsuga]
MYAILQYGNKQYLISEGKIINLDKINNKIGKILFLKKVLFLLYKNKTYIGKPIIKNVKVKIKIIKHDREKKIKIIKFHRRKHHLKKQGHRQWFTKIKVLKIKIK